MRNFQDFFETRKRSFIGAFSIYMTVPLILASILVFVMSFFSGKQRVLWSLELGQILSISFFISVSDIAETYISASGSRVKWFIWLSRSDSLSPVLSLFLVYFWSLLTHLLVHDVIGISDSGSSFLDYRLVSTLPL